MLIALACAGLGASPALAECGRASWYELTGRTASGARANPEALTAAHRKLPFGTKVQVENLSNGRKVTLTIVDRGPFVRGRVIDVSRRAARELKFINKGVTRVRVTVAGRTEASCG
ncbi:septal ring lytic transglycosylase RlpA family protein [Roseibium aggregatum]|uniref:Endolytic peptidoglycan transglycosylase RlpA n=1 Tax=Roseibium aggregatum TaxID=187304 RepID=A0A926P6X5_9HYPH|nr:septal ring lytic transglycosylase RlpA family protein [Roseibium aggregatum]MBD1549812.1 septal ring lytic transglycosylase RlpA family protein [Roseibium aggregatum]